MVERFEKRFFRLHLSTLIVWVFACGFLLRANILPQRHYVNCSFNASAAWAVIPVKSYGWPLSFHSKIDPSEQPEGYAPCTDREFAPFSKALSGNHSYDAGFVEIPIDLVVWAIILLGTPMACELAIRWRQYPEEKWAAPGDPPV